MSCRVQYFENAKLFIKAIKSHVISVVEFFVYWNGKCRSLSNCFSEFIGHEDYSKVLFAKLDVDEAESLISTYKINTYPTFIMFVRGAEVYRFTAEELYLLKERLDDLITNIGCQ
ncbi:hypothetical protein GJ496_004876 [Pomphorhynchus laevis]|nr:hypothetical protein GJ496_004876 [Pomphorhynchus laevis]